jgi:hypothetical protein
VMRSTLSVLVSLSLTGCSFAARSPDTYRDDARSVLATRNEPIRACYDTVLRSNPSARGRVTINFEVETEKGMISHVSVDRANTTAPGAVAECVTKNLDGLSLVPPDGRTGQATWVYDFSANPSSSKSPDKT